MRCFRSLVISATAAWAMITFSASGLAVPISVTSRAALGGDDHVDWGTLGTDGDILGPSFSAVSQGGLNVAVSGANASFNGFERVVQGGTWFGNFADGDALVWTGFGFDPQIITIEFDSPVFGVGAQFQEENFGAFTGFLNAYDRKGNLIHSDIFDGNSSDAADDSAIFMGIVSGSAISRIEIGVEGSGSYVMNQLGLVTPAAGVPEGGEYLGALLVVTVIGMGRVSRVLAKA